MDATSGVQPEGVRDEGASAGIRGLGQVALIVQDVDRATTFYRDVLGLPHLFDAPPAMSFFRCGSVRLMLSMPESSDEARASSILYFDVTDIQEAHALLTTRGVGFVAPPHCVAEMDATELWMAFFRDTEGNTMALMAERAKGASA